MTALYVAYVLLVLLCVGGVFLALSFPSSDDGSGWFVRAIGLAFGVVAYVGATGVWQVLHQ